MTWEQLELFPEEPTWDEWVHIWRIIGILTLTHHTALRNQ